MHLKLIACKVLQREIASILYNCPHTIDVTTMSQWYHETPVILKKALQEEIDRIDAHEDPHTNNLEQRDLAAWQGVFMPAPSSDSALPTVSYRQAHR